MILINFTVTAYKIHKNKVTNISLRNLEMKLSKSNQSASFHLFWAVVIRDNLHLYTVESSKQVEI